MANRKKPGGELTKPDSARAREKAARNGEAGGISEAEANDAIKRAGAEAEEEPAPAVALNTDAQSLRNGADVLDKLCEDTGPGVSSDIVRSVAALLRNMAADQAEDGVRVLDETEIPGFDPEHLTGQLGDYLLTEVKMARHVKPWDQLKEHEQKTLIDRQYGKARGLVQAVAEVIAGKGFKSAPMSIDSATLKDGLKVVLTGVATEDAVLSLARNKGALVQLVFADADEFGGAMISKAEPDQRDMLADAGGDEEVEEPGDETPEAEDEEVVVDEDGVIQDPPTPPAGDPPAATA